MEQPISANDAERALREIALSRERMRDVIRSHHGHAYLWLWGVITLFVCGGTHLFGVQAMQRPSAVADFLGVVASIGIGFWRGRAQRIRVQVDRRFVAVAIMLTVIHLLVIPAIVGWPREPQRQFTYAMLFWTEIYVVAGIWFSNYLVWCGGLCIAFSLLGLFVFSSVFWLWSAITIGGTLIVSGFYVRYRSRC